MAGEFAQLLLNGVVTGSVIAIGAIGLSLVIAVLDIGSFAHGDYMTVGAYAALTVDVALQQNIVLAVLAAILVTAGLGLAMDLLVVRRLRHRSGGSIFIVTLGLALVLRYVVFFVEGSDLRAYNVNPLQVYVVGPIRVTPTQLVVIACAIVGVAALAILLERTRTGKSMRAVADNRDLAAVAGVNTRRIRVYVWLIGSAFAGLAGVLLGLVEQSITPSLGFDQLYLLFAAVILGGVGSMYGTLIGAYVLGLCMELSTWPILFGGLSGAYKPVVGYVILLAVLLVRPQGLFGRTRLL